MTAGKTFRFDSSTHSYYLGEQKLPGVTTILHETGLTWFPYNETVQKAMELGTYVHRAIELFCNGKLDLWNFGLNDEIRAERGEKRAEGYFNAWRKWQKDTGFEPIHVELRMYHPDYLYAGTADCIGRFKGEKSLSIIDWKTGVKDKAYAYQVAAYQEMFRRNYGERTSRYTLYLRSDEKYEMEIYPSNTDASDLNIFFSALTVHRHQKITIKKETEE